MRYQAMNILNAGRTEVPIRDLYDHEHCMEFKLMH
jgi:hypothetical protein